MKVTFDFNVTNEDKQIEIQETLETYSFNDFKVTGIADKFSSKYPVDTCINIKDTVVKNITSNNTDIINLVTLKNKNILNRKPDEYKITFNRLGNGSLKIVSKDDSIRYFGLFSGLKENNLKIGNKFEKGDKYVKFWDTHHSHLLYNDFNVKDILSSVDFVKRSLKLASIPVIILTNEINLIVGYEQLIEELVKNCLYYTQDSNTELYIIVDRYYAENFPKETIYLYNKLLDKYYYKGLRIVFPLSFQKMTNKVDCTRTLGHLEGLKVLSYDAMRIAEKLLSFGINDKWLLGFNTNQTDSYYDNVNTIKFNNDIMINYMFYISKITSALSCKAMMYYIPVGLLNDNSFLKHTNTTCDYEDGSVFFLLGGSFTTTNSFYKENYWNDSLLTIKDNTVSIGQHSQLLLKSNIKYLLFGSETKKGTTSVYSPQTVGRCTDRYHLIKKSLEFK